MWRRGASKVLLQKRSEVEGLEVGVAISVVNCQLHAAMQTEHDADRQELDEKRSERHVSATYRVSDTGSSSVSFCPPKRPLASLLTSAASCTSALPRLVFWCYTAQEK